MFTGLIRDLGVVDSVSYEGQSVHLCLRTNLASSLDLGASLAVNGVCLTVVKTSSSSVVVTAVPETISRTTIGKLHSGSTVNLEPALCAGDPMGGHVVQGHVDAVGTIVGIDKQGLSVKMEFSAPDQILKYIVEKGSIAIDGISLTVASLCENQFTVALIPHTLKVTTLGQRKIGDEVNLEVDILAKYVERLLEGNKCMQQDIAAPKESKITEAWLREKGF